MAQMDAIDRIIDSLPQSPRLKAHHIERTKEFIKQNPAAMGSFSPESYFARLGKIGASELGAFVAYERGEVIDIGATAREIGMRKLLLIDPMIPTPKMMRGTQLEEPVIRPAFLQQYNARSLKNHPAVQTALMSKSKLMPWLGANIDDFVEIQYGDQKVRVLPDYKCPDPSALHSPVSLNYHVQTEMYAARLEEQRHILEDAGLILPGEQVVDCKLLVRWDLENWVPVATPIPIDLDLREEAIAAGEKWFREIFLEGNLPEAIRRTEIHLSDEDRLGIERSGKAYIYWRAQEQFAKQEKDAAGKAIRDAVAQEEGVGIIKAGGVNINIKPSYKEADVVQLATNLGIAPSDFEDVDENAYDATVLKQIVETAKSEGRAIQPDEIVATAKRKLNLESLVAHIEQEYGIMPPAMVGADIRVAMERKGPQFELRKDVEQAAEQIYGHNREHAAAHVYPVVVPTEDKAENLINRKRSADNDGPSF